ncbi:MAG: glycoside hydrolase family 43 protein [Bacteroidota bacterium]
MPFKLSAQNPIVQTVFTADPAPMVYNNTVYLYTGHDEDHSKFFTMNDWRCFSSTDMVNWTDHGSPLSYHAFSWAKGDAWAGQCIFRDGTFYWYVPVKRSDGKGFSIGVAVSKSPTGPFVDALGHSLTPGDWGDIDPTVYINDDGQAYLYWGNPALKYVKLNKDMTSYSGEIQTVSFADGGFGKLSAGPKPRSQYVEGPWFYKRQNLYYMVYPAGGIPEHIAYSTSNSPTGPWTYRDTIMPVIAKGGAFTNHPGLIDFKGKSYFFYHNGDLPGGGGFDRSVCVAEFNYNNDGTIPRIIHSEQGVQNVGNLDPFVRNEAETIAWESGIKTATTSKTGVYVNVVNNGGYIKVRAVNFKKRAKSFNASLSAEWSGGSIEIHADHLDGQLLGRCEVNKTGGVENWLVSSCKIAAIKGVHDIYFVFKGENNHLFNFDWWKFD